MVPELQLVFDDPVIKGALTSVLGEGYMMHPHRVLHDNPPGSDPQVWHHDSYWGYKRKVHNHHPWWVMIMYYPQDIDEHIGPTGVIPGSQYIAQRLEDIDQLGSHTRGTGGACVMIHYDIWHRKMKNFTNLQRFMVKFEFMRMRRPEGVTWDSACEAWSNPTDLPGYRMEPVWRSTWHWLGGRPLPDLAPDPAVDLDDALAAARDRGTEGAGHHARAGAVADIARLGAAAAPAIPALVELLGDDNEAVGLNAAYALAHMGDAGVAPLVAAMRGNDGENVDDARCFIDQGEKSELEMVARNAAHGLVASGLPAMPALLACAREGGPRVRKYALFALGELDTDDDEVTAALVAGCRDEDPAVRLNAVEGLRPQERHSGRRRGPGRRPLRRGRRGPLQRLACPRAPRSGRRARDRRPRRGAPRRQPLHHGLRRRGAGTHRDARGPPGPDPFPQDCALVPDHHHRQPVLTHPPVAARVRGHPSA